MNERGVVGEILDGKYDIEKLLGKGGMGSVYLATHIGTGRPVAVKVIAPEFMLREEFVERFRREAKAAGRLRHPNVVDVTDFGFSDLKNGETVAYLVMEYLDGCTLGEVLDEEKKLPLPFSVDILEQVCSAVEEAHKQGIIHRDLKPDNIWLEPNQRGGYTVKVLDFGIAKLEEASFNSSGNISIPQLSGAIPTRVIQDDKTIAAGDKPETVSENRNSTIISEGETVSIADGSKTIASEAGTIIQEDSRDSKEVEIDSEQGTVILPSGKTRVIEPEGSSETKAASSHADTDDSQLNSSTTANLTRAGAVLGTPLYMSPEQCRGEKLSARSDLYSLAVIIYQMLSGSLPFEGDYLVVMEGHKNLDPPPLDAKKVPKKLKGIVMQGLSKSPDDRPATAEAFVSKVRANSEGLGVLLQRSLMIYTDRLPKFLSLAFLTFLPAIVFTFARVGFAFLVNLGMLEENGPAEAVELIIAAAAFISQVVATAFLVGMITWVVGQMLAYPLRPISLRGALREVYKRWKPLAFTVTVSTLLTIFSAFLGFVISIFAWSPQIGAIYYFLRPSNAVAFGVITGVFGSMVLFVTVASYFMLIAPSVMMEDVRGIAAFKRSISLVNRSSRTVIAAAVLVYVIPMIFASIVAVSIGSVIHNVEMSREIEKMKIEGVEPQKPEVKEAKDSGEVNFNINGSGLNITTGDSKEKKESDEKDEKKGFAQVLREAIFEIVWTPIAILITSFTTVITALIYFKTRQAGGESMQELLGKLDDADIPQSKWQQRVRERLIQSGKITGNTSGST